MVAKGPPMPATITKLSIEQSYHSESCRLPASKPPKFMPANQSQGVGHWWRTPSDAGNIPETVHKATTARWIAQDAGIETAAAGVTGTRRRQKQARRCNSLLASTLGRSTLRPPLLQHRGSGELCRLRKTRHKAGLRPNASPSMPRGPCCLAVRARDQPSAPLPLAIHGLLPDAFFLFAPAVGGFLVE
jgi:hypothetical protein